MVTTTVAEYKTWLKNNGMSEAQARIIAPKMAEEQLPMSVPLVLGMINGQNYIGNNTQVNKTKHVEIRERFEM